MTAIGRFCLCCLAVGCMCGCDFGEPPLAMPALDPSAAGKQALADYDANQDGAIAGEEFNKAPGLNAALAKLDKDQDKRLTGDEIAARLTAYQTIGISLATAGCQVTYNGKPLAQAVVTLKPEPFMGPSIKEARATTDEHGGGTFQIEGEPLKGAHCGIYRVEVSKKDANGKETVPAKYNVETTLGVDVGPGGTMSESSLVLKLSGG